MNFKFINQLCVLSLSILLLPFATTTSALAKVLELKKIAGKSPAEVTKILGKPSSPKNVRPSGTGCNPCPKMTYQKDRIEVIFINGKADWITINELSTFALSPSILSQFGLPSSKPSTSNASSISWDSIPGFSSVDLFGFGGQADYLYVKVKTK